MRRLFTLLLMTASAAPAEEISLSLDKPGNVSAAIYDAQGRMVRELARAEPLAAGKH